MSLLRRIDEFGPAVCRLRARHGRGMMSTREIARRSGLKKSTVHKISMLTSWESVPVGVAERFARACGVDLMAPHRQRWILRVRSWAFMVANIKPKQRPLFDRLLTNAKAAAQRAA